MTREWPFDTRGDRSRFDEDTRPVPVLSSGIGTAVRQTELADVPVRRVGGRAAGHARVDLGERVGTVGGPEADCARGEVNVVCEVVPVSGNELRCPLRLAVYIPTEGVVGRASFAIDETVFNFSAVRLQGKELNDATKGKCKYITSKKAIWCSKPGLGGFVDVVISEKW